MTPHTAAHVAAAPTGTSILWASLIASAVVAAVVTLVVEYLAKPALDARKDRILEAGKRRRDALRGLHRAAYIAGRMQVLAARAYEVPAFYLDRQVTWAAEVEQLVEDAAWVLAPPASVVHDWRRTAACVATFATCVRSDAVPADAWPGFSADRAKLDPYADLFGTPRWRWWRRHRLAQRILRMTQLAIVAPDVSAG